MQDIAVMLARYLPKLAFPQVGITDVIEIALISFFVYQHHSLDRKEFVYCADYCSDHYFSARTS